MSKDPNIDWFKLLNSLRALSTEEPFKIVMEYVAHNLENNNNAHVQAAIVRAAAKQTEDLSIITKNGWAMVAMAFAIKEAGRD